MIFFDVLYFLYQRVVFVFVFFAHKSILLECFIA